jgi:hypothetical protein
MPMLESRALWSILLLVSAAFRFTAPSFCYLSASLLLLLPDVVSLHIIIHFAGIVACLALLGQAIFQITLGSMGYGDTISDDETTLFRQLGLYRFDNPWYVAFRLLIPDITICAIYIVSLRSKRRQKRLDSQDNDDKVNKLVSSSAARLDGDLEWDPGAVPELGNTLEPVDLDDIELTQQHSPDELTPTVADMDDSTSTVVENNMDENESTAREVTFQESPPLSTKPVRHARHVLLLTTMCFVIVALLPSALTSIYFIAAIGLHVQLVYRVLQTRSNMAAVLNENLTAGTLKALRFWIAVLSIVTFIYLCAFYLLQVRRSLQSSLHLLRIHVLSVCLSIFMLILATSEHALNVRCCSLTSFKNEWTMTCWSGLVCASWCSPARAVVIKDLSYRHANSLGTSGSCRLSSS